MRRYHFRFLCGAAGQGLNMHVAVSVSRQTLELYGDDGTLLACYPVSTAAKGVGEQYGSFQTPRGKHIIRAKIGAGCAPDTIFVRRRPTGEMWTPELAAAHPGRDWILTRILWLSGCEVGKNRLGSCDTMRRYIYIHGCPESATIGHPGSHGCIRMRNQDIIEFFDRVPVYTAVEICE